MKRVEGKSLTKNIVLIFLLTVLVLFFGVGSKLLNKPKYIVSADANGNTIYEYESNFSTSSTEQSTISNGWQKVSGFANGTLYEQDGALILDNSTTTYSIGTAGYTEINSKNYMISADLTMESKINSSRWMGIFYRQSEVSCLNMFAVSANNTANFNGYYTASIYQGGTNGWYSDKGNAIPKVTFSSDSPFYNKVFNGETVNLCVVVIGQRLVGYVDGICLLDWNIPFENKFTEGYAGICCAGAKVRIENFKITSLEEFNSDGGENINHEISLPTKTTSTYTAKNVPNNYVASATIDFNFTAINTSVATIDIATVGTDRVYLQVYKNGTVNLVRDNGTKTTLLEKNIAIADVENISILVKHVNNVVQISVNGEVVGERWLGNSVANFAFTSGDYSNSLNALVIKNSVKRSVYDSNFSILSSSSEQSILYGWKQEPQFGYGTLYEKNGAMILYNINNENNNIGAVGYTEVTSKDYMVSVDLTMLSSKNDSRWMGLYYRQKDSYCLNLFNLAGTNYASFGGYYTEIYNPNGKVGWYHDNGGSAEINYFAENSPLYNKVKNGETVNLCLVVIGDRVVGYVDGYYIASYIMPFGNRFPNGYVGVCCSGAEVKIENFKVTSLEEVNTATGENVNHGISLPTQGTTTYTAKNMPTNYITNANVGFNSSSTETSCAKLDVLVVGTDRVYLELYKNGKLNLVRDNGIKTTLLEKNITIADVENISVRVKHVNNVIQITINDKIEMEYWVYNSVSKFAFTSSDGNSVLNDLSISNTTKNLEGVEVIAPSVLPYGEVPKWTEILEINYVWSDGARESIDFTDGMISGFDKDTCGKQTLTFTYTIDEIEKTKEFTVVVHSFGDWQITQYPTLESKGIERRECSCGGYQEREWVTYHTIAWKGEDDEILEVDINAAYGQNPTYNGATPTKTPSLENAFAFDGWTTEVEQVTGDATYTAKFKNVAVAFYSLSVKETIGINFYLDIEKYTNDANAYVEIEYNHNTIDYAPDVRKDRIYVKNAIKDDNKGLYRFSLSFSSGQIADNINIKLCSVGGETLFKKDNYSILTYCQTVITSEETKNDEALVNLCKSIIDYGKYAKEYFEYKPEEEAIKESGLDLPESISIDANQDVTTEQELQSITNVTNAKFDRYSFVAYSDTSIRIYFKLENGASIDDYTASISPVDGSSMNVKLGTNTWGGYVEVYGIESANINKVFNVTLTHTDGKSTTITYSALHYLSEKMQDAKSTQALKNMCLAIYQYNLYAIAYFGE